MSNITGPRVGYHEDFQSEVKLRSDRLMNYFLISYFLLGIILAGFYSTWLIAFSVGGISLLAYYSVKVALPDSNLYQYVLGVVLGIFMAQFIYQMHGLFEMHFFAFIGSAILITYQKWKLQIPLLIVVSMHHLLFSYLQNAGNDKIYFTQLDYFTLQTFIIHILLTSAIFFICGLWAYQLNKYSQVQVSQALQMAELQKEAQLSTERKQHAEILTLLNKDLEQKAKELAFSNTGLEQFAYVASHDMQEPLRTITSFLKQLERKYSQIIDDKGKQYIHYAVDGAERMRQIIFDLLEFSRVGRTEDKLEEVDICEIVTEITGLYAEQIKQQQAKIEFGNLPKLQTFKTPLRQVFQNLIANGLKYQKKGEKPLINISCEETEMHWLFSVKDNGIGIKADDLDQIFIIFKRLHNREEYAGNGIGLAVTKKIIENIGGEIWVESTEGTGSTFYLTVLKNRLSQIQ
jgi:two-component system sensor histidine kinase/response regulator